MYMGRTVEWLLVLTKAHVEAPGGLRVSSHNAAYLVTFVAVN